MDDLIKGLAVEFLNATKNLLANKSCIEETIA